MRSRLSALMSFFFLALDGVCFLSISSVTHFFKGVFSHNLTCLPQQRLEAKPALVLLWNSPLSRAWLLCGLKRTTAVTWLPVLRWPGLTIHCHVPAAFTIVVSWLHAWRVGGQQWRWLLVRRKTSSRLSSSVSSVWAWNEWVDRETR